MPYALPDAIPDAPIDASPDALSFRTHAPSDASPDDQHIHRPRGAGLRREAAPFFPKGPPGQWTPQPASRWVGDLQHGVILDILHAISRPQGPVASIQRNAVCVLSLNGEPVKVRGLEDASSVRDVRVLTAAALGARASSVKLVLLAHDVTDPSHMLLQNDDQKLVDLPATQFVVVRQAFDPSLVELTSDEKFGYDEGQWDLFKTSWLSYGGTDIWNMRSHRAVNEAWSGSIHTAELSADREVLTVLTGMVRRESGDMCGSSDEFAPKMETLSVVELVIAKGLS